MAESALLQLAHRYGIHIERSQVKAESPEGERGLVALLQAAGVGVASENEARSLLAGDAASARQPRLAPLVVTEQELPLRLRLAIPETGMRDYRWVVQEESGQQWHGEFTGEEQAAPLRPDAPDSSLWEYVIETGTRLPCGYHRLKIFQRGLEEATPLASAPLIVAPASCYIPSGISGRNRVWGLSFALQAVRSGSNWGVGDFGDLQKVLSWGAQQGAGVVRTPPLTCLDAGRSQYNPYSPSSRSHLDPLYVNLEEAIREEGGETVTNLLQDARFQARLAALRSQDNIDYEAVFRVKEEAFRLLWQHFSACHLNPETGRGQAFRQFQEKGGELLRSFSLYMAIQEHCGDAGSVPAGWKSWPEPLRHPESDAVMEFARGHEYELEYQQYRQWTAARQLAAVGRRSMELGLKIGLLAEFPCSWAEDGFESWLNQDLQFAGARIIAQDDHDCHADPATGLPLPVPGRLAAGGYQPLISGLRHTMAQAGAVCILSIEKYFKASFQLATDGEPIVASAHFPCADLLNIIALESHRNQCLVIADHGDLLSAEQKAELKKRRFFSGHFLFERIVPGNSLLDGEFPCESVLCTSPPFLAGLKGLWKAEDIRVRTSERMFRSERERDRAILSRALERAGFLIGLEHERLLPEGCELDQANVPDIDQGLMLAGQLLLARSAAGLVLVTFNDLSGNHLQASTPSMSDQSCWRNRYELSLQELFEHPETGAVFEALRRERGVGVRRPSAPTSARGRGRMPRVPTAFYRLQLHKGFTFLQAAEILPYLQRLGISHCYLSPFLMARPGSPHGYDIIDHCRLNPEIGTREDFEKFIDVLDECGMALLMDIVPNHMGIGTDNSWWMDVLENGQASIHAGFFDINWTPLQWDMVGRVLLPVLGEHYETTLEEGKLTLTFDAAAGSFFIRYHDHAFPLDPATYPDVLAGDLARLSGKMGENDNYFMEYQGIVSGFAKLSNRERCAGEIARVRHRDKEIYKHLLARLCGHCPEVRAFIEENVILFNGEQGKPASYDLLHGLLEKQAYRLAFWRVAADEINYRRFFDINDLAGLRMEEKEVFTRTHRLVIDLIATGKVDGLRIDHPDGLYDPCQYFRRLDDAAMHDGFLGETSLEPRKNGVKGSIYVVVEKILADYEQLPRAWPVYGTTGYDFCNSLNSIFVDRAAEKNLTSLYCHFIGRRVDFDELLYNSKKQIITSAMVGELNVLTSLLFHIARENRNSRDFTLNLLRQGLTEIVASFPVYRTYITSEKVEKRDADFIKWAVSRARAGTSLIDISVFDFIQRVLLLQDVAPEVLPRWLDFVMKVQQYTGPVMAKGLEDTSFYIYNRLLSLNEVGSNPRRFGMSLSAFHQNNQNRRRHWPLSMVNSSTHDSKRSEDVRARINVLTEMVPQWRKGLLRWNRFNRSLKTRQGGGLIPDRNDEYAFYQNLLGCWPGQPADADRHHFSERMAAAAIKACREAKQHTSWLSPNEAYEQAVDDFITGVLDPGNTEFLRDFSVFHESIAWFGMLNGLSQVFLKLVVPGIPDIYQGNELWRYCLVDPDNRRPVDFSRRQSLLAGLERQLQEQGADTAVLQRGLLDNFSDGQVKMYTIYRTLRLRGLWQDVFAGGRYIPLQTGGSRSSHVCAFMRVQGKRAVIAAAPRFCFRLMKGKPDLPVGPEVWGDTVVSLPSRNRFRRVEWTNLFSEIRIGSETAEEDACSLRAGRLFQSWPVALLTGEVR
jgi:(1->4)-alpha-D-glucan 1-alpha-D-glucosylmutase